MIKIECPNTTMFRAAIRSHIDSLTEAAKASGESLMTPGNVDHGVEHVTKGTSVVPTETLNEFASAVTGVVSETFDIDCRSLSVIPTEDITSEVPGLPGTPVDVTGVATLTMPDTNTLTGHPTCPVTGEVLDVVGGYPWDGRIHGKAQKTNADGKWRLTQGIAKKHPGIIERVQAEFDARRAGGSTTTDAVETPSSLFETATAETPQDVTINVGAPPITPVAAELAEMPESPTLADYLEYTTARIAVRPEYQADIDGICVNFKFNALGDVIKPGVTPEVFSNFGQWLEHEWKKYQS
jgi:hypothetical protein